MLIGGGRYSNPSKQVFSIEEKLWGVLGLQNENPSAIIIECALSFGLQAAKCSAHFAQGSSFIYVESPIENS